MEWQGVGVGGAGGEAWWGDGGGRGRWVGGYGGAVGADFAAEGVIFEVRALAHDEVGIAAIRPGRRGGAEVDVVADISHVIRHGDVHFPAAGDDGSAGAPGAQILGTASLQPGETSDSARFLPRTAGVEVAAHIRSPEAGPLAPLHRFSSGVCRVERGDHDEVPTVVEIPFHGGLGNSIRSDGDFFADAARQSIITEAESDGIQGPSGDDRARRLRPGGSTHADEAVLAECFQIAS